MLQPTATNFLEEKLTQQAELPFDNSPLAIFFLQLIYIWQKCLLYNDSSCHFLHFVFFPLWSVPGECLQVFLISLLQFVALQIALNQYSQLFPEQILSQPEQACCGTLFLHAAMKI